MAGSFYTWQVSCAAGLAVLDVIESADLRPRAAATGAYLCARLESLADTDDGALIGEVRGGGLFLGVDLVRNRATREPATAEASALVSALKERHRILASLDGPAENVIIIKPPLVFGEGDADALVTAMRAVMRAMRGVDFTDATRTPT